jgi:hypothetical protein
MPAAAVWTRQICSCLIDRRVGPVQIDRWLQDLELLLALAPGQVRHLLQPFPEARPAHRRLSRQLDSRQTADSLDSSVHSTDNGDSAICETELLPP